MCTFDDGAAVSNQLQRRRPSVDDHKLASYRTKKDDVAGAVPAGGRQCVLASAPARQSDRKDLRADASKGRTICGGLRSATR